MPSKSDCPGLQWSPRKDGPDVPYWVRSHAARRAGYPIKSRRLDTTLDLAEQCERHQTEMEAWLAGEGRRPWAAKYDGTFRSLITLYETDEFSPYRQLKRYSRESADYELRKLRRAVGERRLANLNGRDFRRWYWTFREPAYEGGPERVTHAYNLITRVRTLLSYAIELRVPHAAELRDILSRIKFPMPEPRTQALTYEQTRAFVVKAHELGFPEIALAEVLQFELTFRQTDVIGKWEYVNAYSKSVGDRRLLPGGDRALIRTLRDGTMLVWVGLRWEEISEDWTLTHKTSKRGRPVGSNLKDNELVYAELCKYAPLPRSGPMIVDGRTGEPFEPEEFRRLWRIIARAAGIPDDIQNRDSRAGGITEARDAGAATDDIQQLAGHADRRTTGRYIRRSVEPATRVAQKRRLYRSRSEQVLNPRSNAIQMPSNDDWSSD